MTDPQLQEALVPLESIRISYGATRAEFVEEGVREVFAPAERGICKNDIAVLLLTRPLAEVHVPVRLEAVRAGERFTVTGWGQIDDVDGGGPGGVMPDRRLGLDDVRVHEVGRPAGSFWVRGGNVCYGDSGAGAIFEGALGGTFSKIISGTNQLFCTVDFMENEFVMTAAHRALFERAFAAAGRKPWYAGEPAPWADAGACADGGGPCAPLNSAAVDGADESGGCTLTRSRSGGLGGGLTLALLTLGLRVRRARRPRST